MQQRKLGAHGPLISAIGIGAMSFSDFYGATSEAESHAILTAALDQGVTHIDTADVYGDGTSETVIGTFLQHLGHRKNQLFSIATKAGIAPTKIPANAILTIRQPISNNRLIRVWRGLGLIILTCFMCIAATRTRRLKKSPKLWQPSSSLAKLAALAFPKLPPPRYGRPPRFIM